MTSHRRPQENDVKPTRTATSEQTRTQVKVEVLREALRRASLDAAEEQVIRLRFGIGETPDAPLAFRGQSHEQSRVKLAMFERDLLNDMRDEQLPPEVTANKERLLDKLRRLGDQI